MHLKRYRSATVREALAQAKLDLGPGALVLSTRLVPRAGFRGWLGEREVEVTAAADRGMSAGRLDEPVPGPGHGVSALIRRAPIDLHVVARLCATGFDRPLAEEVARRLPRGSRRGASAIAIRRAVAETLQPLAAGDEPPRDIEVFVGPPGVGKTTTIAKIAAQARAARGVRLALISADGFRLGAIEQLRTYAEVIGTSFDAATTAEELGRLLAASRVPTLVDTAGRSPHDPGLLELIPALGNRERVRLHLVLPAALGPRAAERLMAAYQPVRPDRIVLTKVDEAESIAPLASVLHGRCLPVSYLGTGQRVPEDLQRATSQALASHIVGDTGAPGLMS